LSSTCPAARFGIDDAKLPKLKYRLLDKWLPEKTLSGPGGGDLDETITSFDFLKNFRNGANGAGGGSADDVTQENETNFLRCVYLLQGCECFDYTLQVSFIIISRWRHYSQMFPSSLFHLLKKLFLANQNATCFIWDQCCHLGFDGT